MKATSSSFIQEGELGPSGSVPGVELARSLLSAGKPAAALEALMQVVEDQSGGDKAVALEYLHKMMHQRPPGSVHQQFEEARAGGASVNLGGESSVLAESGSGRAGDILLAAASDGSSFVCAHCQALIPLKRLDAHMQTWCPVVGKMDDEIDVDESDG